MKKVMACLLVVVFLMGSVNVVSAAQGTGRGGVMGFIAGCCFGIRAGAAYNDGKEIHWREWVMLLPYINIIFISGTVLMARTGFQPRTTWPSTGLYITNFNAKGS